MKEVSFLSRYHLVTQQQERIPPIRHIASKINIFMAFVSSKLRYLFSCVEVGRKGGTINFQKKQRCAAGSLLLSLLLLSAALCCSLLCHELCISTLLLHKWHILLVNNQCAHGYQKWWNSRSYQLPTHINHSIYTKISLYRINIWNCCCWYRTWWVFSFSFLLSYYWQQ